MKWRTVPGFMVIDKDRNDYIYPDNNSLVFNWYHPLGTSNDNLPVNRMSLGKIRIGGNFAMGGACTQLCSYHDNQLSEKIKKCPDKLDLFTEKYDLNEINKLVASESRGITPQTTISRGGIAIGSGNLIANKNESVVSIGQGAGMFNMDEHSVIIGNFSGGILARYGGNFNTHIGHRNGLSLNSGDGWKCTEDDYTGANPFIFKNSHVSPTNSNSNDFILQQNIGLGHQGVVSYGTSGTTSYKLVTSVDVSSNDLPKYPLRDHKFIPDESSTTNQIQMNENMYTEDTEDTGNGTKQNMPTRVLALCDSDKCGWSLSLPNFPSMNTCSFISDETFPPELYDYALNGQYAINLGNSSLQPIDINDSVWENSNSYFVNPQLHDQLFIINGTTPTIKSLDPQTYSSTPPGGNTLIGNNVAQNASVISDLNTIISNNTPQLDLPNKNDISMTNNTIVTCERVESSPECYHNNVILGSKTTTTCETSQLNNAITIKSSEKLTSGCIHIDNAIRGYGGYNAQQLAPITSYKLESGNMVQNNNSNPLGKYKHLKFKGGLEIQNYVSMYNPPDFLIPDKSNFTGTPGTLYITDRLTPGEMYIYLCVKWNYWARHKLKNSI